MTHVHGLAGGCLGSCLQRRHQREIDREYGLSGVALLSLEELVCLTHQLCTPTLSGQLVLSGCLAALQVNDLDA